MIQSLADVMVDVVENSLEQVIQSVADVMVVIVTYTTVTAIGSVKGLNGWS